jgi:hypothetical protein
LQNEVIAAQAKLPSRLRTPLLTGVNRLVNRIICTPPPVTVTTPPTPPPENHGNGNGNGNGDGGGNGNGGGG